MNNKTGFDFGLLLFRFAIGGLMLFHGIHKLMAPQQTIEFLSNTMESSGLPAFLAYGVFLGEFIAPLFILVGWRTKLFSPFIAITMLVAIFTAHAGDIFELTKQGAWAIEVQALYLLGSLALSFTGGGRFSLSHKNRWD